jgi:predicted Zn-dependent protease with MMP-like domain
MPMSPAMNGQERTPPTAAEIDTLARASLARIPSPFAQHLADIVLIVEEWADDETLDALGIDDPYNLTGLYHGRPIAEKSAFDSGAEPDCIYLYRRAILDEWVANGEDLATLVHHIVVHEVGHHFGLSDGDMHALEAAA